MQGSKVGQKLDVADELPAGDFGATATGDSGGGSTFSELGVLYPLGVPVTFASQGREKKSRAREGL